jgi:hypothetical protein
LACNLKGERKSLKFNTRKRKSLVSTNSSYQNNLNWYQIVHFDKGCGFLYLEIKKEKEKETDLILIRYLVSG